jgi:hypothetical protein
LQGIAFETFAGVVESKLGAAMVHIYRFCAIAGLALVLWTVRDRAPETFVQPAGAPGPVRILSFYASSGVLITGEKAQLCYGVQNAKSVKIAPPLAGVFPSAKHCVEIVPKHTTHYTILAEGYDGRVAMQSLTLPVQALPEPPRQPLNFAAM